MTTLRSTLDPEAFIRVLADSFADELDEANRLTDSVRDAAYEPSPLYRKQPDGSYSRPKPGRLRRRLDPRFRGLRSRGIGSSTSSPDLLYLYLLARHFQPERIFEVGTWIGASTMMLAEAVKRNGRGSIVSCDVNHVDEILPEYRPFIELRKEHSSASLRQLHDQGAKLDMLFIDGTLGDEEFTLLRDVMSDRAIFAVHDFKPPMDKGVKNLERLAESRPNDGGGWVLPERQGEGYAIGDVRVNRSVGLYLSAGVEAPSVAPA